MLKNVEEGKKKSISLLENSYEKKKNGPYVFLKWMALALTKLFLFFCKTVLILRDDFVNK